MSEQPSPAALDRLIGWSFDHPLTPASRYLLAAVLVLAVGLFRSMAVTALIPWLLFNPTVLLIALTLGRGPGLFASALAAIVAGISIGSVAEPMWLAPQQWIASILFLLVSFAITIVASALRAALARAIRLSGEKDKANASLAEREGFLSSVLGSSTDCIKVLDLDARLTFMSAGGQKVMEVSDFNTIAGCPWPDFWQGRGNQEARAAIEAAKAGIAGGFIGQTPTMAGTNKWWHVAVSPIRGADGRTERILSISRDITDSRTADEERNQLARIVENSADFIGMARTDGSVFFLNDAACQLVGLDRNDIAKVSIVDFFPPDEVDKVLTEVLPAVAEHGNWSGERTFRHFATGELIPVLYTVFPVVDGDGTLIGYGTVTRDFRERKRAEEQHLLLNNELSHRLKNVLAVVQSIASQTLRQADSLDAASEALSARLVALGEATYVLTAQSWSAADLHEVVTRALAPHGGVGERIVVEGVAITLNPEVTLALALALHELATNAAKYGALSNESGRVTLTWGVKEGTDVDDQRFTLKWQETGGPMVAPPTRRGFGSMMIERSLRSYFRGNAQLEYPASGLVFHLDAPLCEAGTVAE